MARPNVRFVKTAENKSLKLSKKEQSEKIFQNNVKKENKKVKYWKPRKKTVDNDDSKVLFSY